MVTELASGRADLGSGRAGEQKSLFFFPFFFFFDTLDSQTDRLGRPAVQL